MIEIKATGSEAGGSGSRSPGKLDFTHPAVVPVEWQIQLEGFFPFNFWLNMSPKKWSWIAAWRIDLWPDRCVFECDAIINVEQRRMNLFRWMVSLLSKVRSGVAHASIRVTFNAWIWLPLTAVLINLEAGGRKPNVLIYERRGSLEHCVYVPG